MLVGVVSAHSGDTFANAEEIINQRISCSELTNEQLEILGDYFMEQMHSGELHEIMDERMGGEGSDSLRQIHINMGKTFYLEGYFMLYFIGLLYLLLSLYSQVGLHKHGILIY
jgi:hypothetical protein